MYDDLGWVMRNYELFLCCLHFAKVTLVWSFVILAHDSQTAVCGLAGVVPQLLKFSNTVGLQVPLREFVCIALLYMDLSLLG